MLDENAVRKEDKEFLFECLKGFPHVLLLSAHLHRQNQYFHTEEDGWKGRKPLHEFNAGAACGDFYSGYLDKDSIPCSMMSDGTPKDTLFWKWTEIHIASTIKWLENRKTMHYQYNYPNRWYITGILLLTLL